MTITKKLPNGNFFFKFFKKTIDKSSGLWYNKDNEREIRKKDKTMKIYVIDKEMAETKEVTLEELAIMISDETQFLMLTDVKADAMTYEICPCGYEY